MSEVILVDMDDRPIGHAEKMYAHEKGLLHRAFSVFLFKGDKLLLQKRAATKYHCGGKWTNTCCSHPGENETVIEAALRRLDDELGISVSELREAGYSLSLILSIMDITITLLTFVGKWNVFAEKTMQKHLFYNTFPMATSAI